MKLTIRNGQGQPQGEREVRFAVIEDGRGTQAVHQTVVAHMAAQRSGTACTKTMGDVAGTGKKPWRQKGTGRARAGSFASPLWRGGGVVFGPKPRDYRQRLSRSTRQLALRKALSARLKESAVILVDDLKLETPKTKGFAGFLKSFEAAKKALIVVKSIDPNLRLAARNLSDVEVTTGDDLNTYQVLRYNKLIFTQSAWDRVEQRLTKE